MLHQLDYLRPLQVFLIFISVITQFFDHVKSSSILELFEGKSRDLQKLVKYFNGTTTSAFILLLLYCVLPTNFVLYSKDLHHSLHLSDNSTNFQML